MTQYYSPLAGQNPYQSTQETPYNSTTGGFNAVGGTTSYDQLQQRLAYEWLNSNALPSGDYANPPFNGGAAGRLHPALNGDKIVRGYIRRSAYDGADPVSKARMYFMYNPETIVRDYVSYLDQAALDPFNTVYGSQNLVAPPSFMNFSFELFFDRQEEVAGNPGHPGVFVDYQFFDLVVRNVVPNSSATSNQLPDNGVMMVNPKDITVVFSPQITIQGRPINAQVRFEKFNHKMTPTRMRISLEMRVLYIGPLRQFEMDQTTGLIGATQQTISYSDVTNTSFTQGGLLGVYTGVPSIAVGLNGPTFDVVEETPVIAPVIDQFEQANDAAKKKINKWLKDNTDPKAVWVPGKGYLRNGNSQIEAPGVDPSKLYNGKILYTTCTYYVDTGYKRTGFQRSIPSPDTSYYFGHFDFGSFAPGTISKSPKYYGKLIVAMSNDGEAFIIDKGRAAKGVMNLSQALAWFAKKENRDTLKEGDFLVIDKKWRYQRSADGSIEIDPDTKKRRTSRIGHIAIFLEFKEINGVVHAVTLEATPHGVGVHQHPLNEQIRRGHFADYVIRPYPIRHSAAAAPITSTTEASLVGKEFS